MYILNINIYCGQRFLQVLQHVSHKATCSLRYERQGQTRTTPGLAARQLNNNG